MKVRGIRGAITVAENTSGAILEATSELLQEMIEANAIETDDIVSIFFTLTDDLDAEFPAVAARDLGMSEVPLLCSREVPVKGSIASCIRVLMQINTDKEQSRIKHKYLRDARKLRPDLDDKG